MKKLFVAALLAGAALALDGSLARADGINFGYCSSSSGSFSCNFKAYCGSGCPPCGNGGGSGGGYGGAVQLGPWYNYWPLEAHFQTPALPQYPYWPAPQAYFQGGYAPAQAPSVYGPGFLPSSAPFSYAGQGYQPYAAPSGYAGQGYQPYAAPSGYSGQGYANPYHTASYPAYWYGR
jgi:hypothetical protein